MNWFLKHKLEKMGQEGDPSPEFVRSLEMKLRAEIGHPVWWIRWPKVATAACSIVMLAGSGTGAYAYNSDEVLPDHPLYAVRQGIEQVEERVAFTPKMKERFRTQIKKRREREKTLLEARKQRQEDRENRRSERKDRMSSR